MGNPRRAGLSIAFVLAFGSALLTAGAARAETPEALKQRGDAAVVALRYQEALEAYEQAYAAAPSPALLYNMSTAYQGLGDYPKALDALEAFKAKAPPELRARVEKLDALIADVRGRVCTLVLGSNVEGAEVRLGTRIVGETHAGQAVIRVSAGRQKLVVSKEGYFTFERELPLPGGRVETVEAMLTAKDRSGILRVTSPIAGAAVAIDGRPVGVVPAESVVQPGGHAVVVARSGYERAETRVLVTAGERKVVDVPMARVETLAGKWWFWTALGVVAAGGVTAAVVAGTTEREADVGSIAPGRVSAALTTF